MNSQFKRGIIEMCIMSLIGHQDMYGFEVIERLAEEIDVNENTVYPILRRLTTQGYFENYMEPTGIGAPRKYYRITDPGKTRLSEYSEEWTKFLQGVFNIMEGKIYEKTVS